MVKMHSKVRRGGKEATRHFQECCVGFWVMMSAQESRGPWCRSLIILYTFLVNFLLAMGLAVTETSRASKVC